MIDIVSLVTVLSGFVATGNNVQYSYNKLSFPYDQGFSNLLWTITLLLQKLQTVEKFPNVFTRKMILSIKRCQFYFQFSIRTVR